MTAIPAIGHNQPPDPMDEIRQRVEALIAGGNAWNTVGEISTADEAAKLEDAFQQARKAFGDTGWLEGARKDMNKPLRDAIAANDELFRPLKAAGQVMLGILSRLRTGWLEKEDDRIQREALEAAQKAEEARKAAEAAAQAAKTIEDIVIVEEANAAAETAASAAADAMRAKPQIKGEYSTRAGSFRTHYSAEIFDLDKATAYYLQNVAARPHVLAAIQAIADIHARKAKEDLSVPGVRLKTERKAV